MAEEIEIGGGAIWTVIVGTLSSEMGAPEACATCAAAWDGAASRQDNSGSKAALKKRRLICKAPDSFTAQSTLINPATQSYSASSYSVSSYGNSA
jgi:hypothetical protein